jgi:hypothetical protein
VTFNSAAISDLYNAVLTGSMTLGVFSTTSSFEPKTAPDSGLNCAVWVDAIKPITSSGLDQTTGVVSFFIRVYNSMLAEPQDQIDPQILGAVSDLMAAYTGEFDFGHIADVRNIDLLGAYSDGLSAQAGYMEISNKMFRVMVISLPVIVDNMFIQEEGS